MKSNSYHPRLFTAFVAALALVVPLAIGCGSGKGKISGNVTLDGNPLPAGTIIFHPSKGDSVAGEITDGQYSVAGVPTGDVKVTVDTAAIKGQADALRKTNQNMAASMGGRMPRGGQIPKEAQAAFELEKQRAEESTQKAKELLDKYRKIPKKYTQEDSSGLTLQVKPGSQNFDAPLSSK